MKAAVETVAILTKGDKDFDEMNNNFTNIKSLQEKFGALETYITFLGKVNNTANFKKGIDNVIDFRNKVAQYGVAPQINELLKDMAEKKKTAKGLATADKNEQMKYVEEKIKG